MKKNENIVKICTEKQRRAIVSLLCDNADTVCEYFAKVDEDMLRLHDAYIEINKSNDKFIKAQEERFLSLVSLSEDKGKELTKLSYELLDFAKKQQGEIKDQRDYFFREYRELIGMVATISLLLSKKGVDIERLGGKEEQQRKDD